MKTTKDIFTLSRAKSNDSARPDVAETTKATYTGVLNKVGMEKVELPIKIRSADGLIHTIPAKSDLYVSLDKAEAKGIHMSRLYLSAQKFYANNELQLSNLAELVREMLSTHEGLSNSAYVKVDFEYMIEREALKSSKKGWKYYPVAFKASMEDDKLTLDIDIRIIYSSTCPCSAALSRQLMQQEFMKTFADQDKVDVDEVAAWINSEKAMVATPHSQRSYADVTLRFNNEADVVDLVYLINTLEDALATPVQAAVKREDEQEFARLNGTNLMFGEDAARRIKAKLEDEPAIADYRVHVQHLESLHPHDAVAIATKGITNGLAA